MKTTITIKNILELIKSNKEFKNEKDFFDKISETYGSETQYITCSERVLTNADLIDFLVERNKIIISSDGKISYDQSDKCSEKNENHNPHEHKHSCGCKNH